MEQCIRLMRGQIYLASVPYKINKSANIFYCIETDCNECKKDKCLLPKKINLSKLRKNLDKTNCHECEIKDSNKGCKGILANNINVKEIEFDKKRERAIPINIVNRIKTRPYIILKCNSIGTNKDFVFGVPCYSIKKEALNNQEFMIMLINGEIPNYYYLDNKTRGINKPSFIDLSYITAIHKENLIEYKGYVEPADLFEINIRLEEVFDLKSFNDCDDIELLERQKESLQREVLRINQKINEIKRKNNS